MKVLVLGGTGLLGPPLARALVADGHQVHAFNRGRHPERLPAGVTLWRGDRARAEELPILSRLRADVVIDVMGWYPQTLPRLLEILADPARLLVLVSSVAVYAPDGGGALSEESPTGRHPVWGTFGELKLACEEAYRAAAAGGTPTVILRPAHLWGFDDPACREARLAALLAAGREIELPDGGGARLQFVHYRDVVELCRRLVGVPPPPSDLYNVAAEATWTIRGWIEAVARTVGVCPAFRSRPFTWPERRRFLYWPGDVVVSAGRLERELDFHPRLPLEQGAEP